MPSVLLAQTVIVRARSHSFWRTIKGRLRRSLRWWPTHHCSVPHHYHWPPSSDLYRSSIRILPPLWYHQQNMHSYHCHYQPAPCAICHSTTRAPPCSTHVPCSRPIILRMHQFSKSWVPVTTRTCEDLSRHPSEYESLHYMFILLPYALQVNSLYVYVFPLYKYSSLLYVFH